MVEKLPSVGQDPLQALVLPAKEYYDEVYDYPIEQDSAGKLVPGYATSWVVSPDHLMWTFTIRSGVKFHNGDTLTAEDIAWSWSRLIFDPASKHVLHGFVKDYESIKADSDKVIVKTTKPVADLLLALSKQDEGRAGAALSKKYFETKGAAFANQNPMGTGPYKWVEGNEQQIKLTAFTDDGRSEWQKSRTAGFKDVTIRAVPDASTRLALLQTKDADVVKIELTQLDQATRAGARAVTSPNATFSAMLCLGFTLNLQSACNDRRLREALAVAIDRTAIANSVYAGKARPSAAFVGGPGTMGYPDDLQPMPYDPERSKKLLAEAGFTAANPLKLQIITYDDPKEFPMLPTLAQAIAGYYQKIGVNATVLPMEKQALRQKMREDKSFPGLLGTKDVTPVTLFLQGFDNRYFMVSDEIQAYTAQGRSGKAAWDNKNLPEQQTRLDAIGKEFDIEKQAKLMGDYYKWMAANYNHIPLLAADSVFGVSSKIKSWTTVVGKPYIHNTWTMVPAD